MLLVAFTPGYSFPKGQAVKLNFGNLASLKRFVWFFTCHRPTQTQQSIFSYIGLRLDDYDI